MNPPKLTILAADTDAACDPETGACTVPQTPIPSPVAAPVTERHTMSRVSARGR